MCIRDSVNIIMDGAHNPQKMESFVKSFINKYRAKANIILSFKDGKDYPDTLKYITKISDKIYLTKFVSSKDLPAKSIEPSLIAKELVELNFKNFEIIDNYEEAFIKAMDESKNKNLIITGSFYLIAQIRNKFNL